MSSYSYFWSTFAEGMMGFIDGNFSNEGFSLDPSNFARQLLHTNGSGEKKREGIVVERVALPILAAKERSLLPSASTDNESKVKIGVLKNFSELHPAAFHRDLQFPLMIWKRVFRSYTPQELRERLGNEGERQNLSSQLKIAEKNQRLFLGLKEVYGAEAVENLFAQVNEEKRDEILSGRTSFDRYYEKFRTRLQSSGEAPLTYNSVGELIGDEEIEEFFLNASCVGFREGYQGVYIFKGIINGIERAVAVKAVEKPRQELFGTKVLSFLGDAVPTTKFIPQKSEEGLCIERRIKVERKEGAAPRKDLRPTEGYMMMSYIEGKTLEELRESDLIEAYKRSDDPLSSLLRSIGKITAHDLLIYNKDRSPLLGLGNSDNLIVTQKGSSLDVVAIDQVANLDQSASSLSSIMGEKPIERVASILDDILTNEGEESVKILMETLESQGVISLFGERRAAKELYHGLLEGVLGYKEIRPEILRSIYREVTNEFSVADLGADRIDIEYHIQMLETIQNRLSSQDSPL